MNELWLNVSVNNFSVRSRQSLCTNQCHEDLMCLPQGHNLAHKASGLWQTCPGAIKTIFFYHLLHLRRVKISRVDFLALPDSVTLTPGNPVTLTHVTSDFVCHDLEMTGYQGHHSVYLCVICLHHCKDIH